MSCIGEVWPLWIRGRRRSEGSQSHLFQRDAEAPRGSSDARLRIGTCALGEDEAHPPGYAQYRGSATLQPNGSTTSGLML
jgi:hypothetical protein